MRLAKLGAFVFVVACDASSVTTTSADVCANDSECTLTSFRDKHPQCPSIDCPFQPATAKCVSNRCVAVH